MVEGGGTPMIQVMYFASMKEAAGAASERLEWSGGTLEELMEKVSADHPAINWSGVRIALNEEFCSEDHAVAPGDVVAFIPPVSGG